jgi:tripeptide aminopeptidase
MEIPLNAERLRRTFIELAEINSPPGHEAPVADYLRSRLAAAGFALETDPAGNLLAWHEGSTGAEPIFFSAHMDTVAPTVGLRVKEEDDVFRSGGETILGADDKAGLAAILEVAESAHAVGWPFGPIQLLLSTREEVGLRGAMEMDPARIRARTGFVLDTSGPPGWIVTAAPWHDILTIKVDGRAAHAGIEPEKGISALQVAARAIARIPLGRLDVETTANVGIFNSGKATNVVPAVAEVRAEVRSLTPAKVLAHVDVIRTIFEQEAQSAGAHVTIHESRAYGGYRRSESDPAPAMAAAAWRDLGGEPHFRPTGGGSDANVFAMHGIEGAVISCGYRDPHAVTEHLPWQDLWDTTRWVAAIAARAAAR